MLHIVTCGQPRKKHAVSVGVNKSVVRENSFSNMQIAVQSVVDLINVTVAKVLCSLCVKLKF